ncbi:CASP-like protein BLE3 [Ananas comosus]|uniref:CASP-like protein n=1 Tax=Ananas comosus TaxID=4615 RepID=A0A199US32_ANACO|nr:CASP-like protein BLE3 [Ananas comosus]OAY67564.1 CASP-like protein 1C1 [Ananas comosus]
MAKALRACVFLLRLFAAAATLVAAVVMATSHETTSYFGFTMEAKFQYTSSFVFFVIANAIASGYSLLVLLIPSTSSFSRLVIATDVIIGMLLTSAVAATGALSELGKNGNQHAGWLPICGQIHEFCNHVMGALICAFVGLLIYLLILFHTFYVVINPLFP